MRPSPRVYPHTLYFQKLSLAYIFVADSMGLSSFKFLHWAPKDASFPQHSAFWPFKVIQGRWFWYQSKARVWLPICPPLWLYGPILHCFWDTATYWLKIAYFSYPSSYWTPSLTMFPLEFRAEVNRQENRVMGLSCSEDRMIVAGVVLAWYQRG